MMRPFKCCRGKNKMNFLLIFLKFCRISQQKQQHFPAVDIEGQVNCVDTQQNLKYIPNSANVLLFLTFFNAEQDEEEDKLVGKAVTNLTGNFRISAFPLVLSGPCHFTLVAASSCHHLSYHGAALANQRTKPGCRFVQKIVQRKMKEFRHSIRNIQLNVNEAEVQCNWWRVQLKSRRNGWDKKMPLDEVGTLCAQNDLHKNANDAARLAPSAAAPVATTKVPPFSSSEQLNQTTTATVKQQMDPSNEYNQTCSAGSSPAWRPLDVVLLLDGSGSITSTIFYSQMLHFAKELARNLNLSTDGSHLAIVQFSDRPKLEFGLNSGNNAQTIRTKINKIAFLDGGTNIGKALLFTLDSVLPVNNTNGEGTRNNSDRFVVVVTDGVSSDDVVQPANALRARAKAQLITIGIGEKIDKHQLNLISGNPQKVYALKTFDQLDAGLVTKSIQQQDYCEEI